jgi:ABC-2 type transport system ATP-binding protein
MIIQTDNLWKRFGRFDALRGLTLNVPEGSAFALLGANGAGKTTTIKVLMNLLQPIAGSATLLGVDSRRISPNEWAQIGYVSENQQMPDHMTVAAYVSYLRPFYPNWDRTLESQIVRDLRLPLDRRIGDLSHGMRMKMVLACALPFRPKLLVLDEPLSGLDPLVRDDFMEGLKPQIGETTILISSHELAEIEDLITHVAYLDRGEVLFQETTCVLAGRLREVRVTLATEARLPARVPKEWLNLRAADNALTFVDTQFSEADLASRVAAVVDGVREIDAQPVALRSIYTTLARAMRDRSISL